MVVFLFKLFSNKFARDNNYTYLYINIKKAVQLLKLCKNNMKNLTTAFQATFSGSASNSQLGLVLIVIAIPAIICYLTFGHLPKY